VLPPQVRSVRERFLPGTAAVGVPGDGDGKWKLLTAPAPGRSSIGTTIWRADSAVTVDARLNRGGRDVAGQHCRRGRQRAVAEFAAAIDDVVCIRIAPDAVALTQPWRLARVSNCARLWRSCLPPSPIEIASQSGATPLLPTAYPCQKRESALTVKRHRWSAAAV